MEAIALPLGGSVARAAMLKDFTSWSFSVGSLLCPPCCSQQLSDN